MNAPAPPPKVAIEHRASALWLTLSRPEKLNALDPEMVEGLHGALAEASQDPRLRVIVITGAGRAFCAGADIGGEAGSEPETQRRAILAFTERVGALTLAIERHPLPVIAAVNGTALAGGLEIALACDLVVASTEAKIGDGHARYGLLPGGGSSVRLPRRLAPAKAKWLLMSGELLPAGAPLLADLFTAVVPGDALEAEVTRMAELLAGRSPLVVRRMKELARASLEQSVEVGLANERLANSLHFYSEDRREGLAAFRERRSPRFTGR